MGIGSEWLRAVLHELAQPLNRIRITAQDIRIDVREKRVEVASLSDSMLEIEREVDLLARRFDLLRRMALPHERTPSLSPKEDRGDLCAALRNQLDRARESFPELTTEIETTQEILVDGITAWALELAIWELVCNAVEAAQDAARPPRVTVRCSRRDDDVVIAVEDNGPGIRADAVASVFAPFFTTHRGAAGMGLAFARSLVADLGGTLELAPSTDAGATFHIVLAVRDGAPHDGDDDELVAGGR